MDPRPVRTVSRGERQLRRTDGWGRSSFWLTFGLWRRPAPRWTASRCLPSATSTTRPSTRSSVSSSVQLSVRRWSTRCTSCTNRRGRSRPSMPCTVSTLTPHRTWRGTPDHLPGRTMGLRCGCRLPFFWTLLFTTPATVETCPQHPLNLGPESKPHCTALRDTASRPHCLCTHARSPLCPFTSCAFRYCGNLALAKAAAQGFASPVYLAQVTGAPGNLTTNGLGAPGIRFAYHAWDTTAAICAAGGAFPEGYTATDDDFTFGHMIADSWFDLATHGVLDKQSWVPVQHGAVAAAAAATAGLTSEAVGKGAAPAAGFHTSVIAKHGISAEPGYRAEVCAWWDSRGVGANWWWVN